VFSGSGARVVPILALSGSCAGVTAAVRAAVYGRRARGMTGPVAGWLCVCPVGRRGLVSDGRQAAGGLDCRYGPGIVGTDTGALPTSQRVERSIGSPSGMGRLILVAVLGFAAAAGPFPVPAAGEAGGAPERALRDLVTGLSFRWAAGES